MPFIKARRVLHSIRNDGDKKVFTHIEDNRPIIATAAQDRRAFDRSFTIGRDAWPVARVPELLFKQFELPGGNVDWDRFDHWYKSEYGRPFRTS
jgi:hypothetical protein